MEEDDGAPFFLPSGEAGVALKKEAATIMAEVSASHGPPAPTVHYQTATFLHPHHTAPLGICTNGQFALGLCCRATTTSGTGQSATNPLSMARVMWMREEQEIYYLACKRHAAAQPDQVDLERTRLSLIRTIDPVLRKPIDSLLKEWEKVPRVESQAVTKMTVQERTKPAQKFECTAIVMEQWAAPPKWAKEEGPWHLVVREIPRKAPRRAAHLSGWKDVTGTPWDVAVDCVPVVVFNATHVVAIYQHSDPAAGGVVLDCSTLICNEHTKKWSLASAWVIRAPTVKETGNYVVRLSPQGVLAWAVRRTIWVTTLDTPMVARVFEFEPHVVLMSIALCDETRTLTVGTSRGEVLSFNWETAADDSLDILLTPCEEPVLAVHRDAAAQGRNMAMTISSVVGRLMPGATHFKALEMERPTAMAAAGERVMVMNKYGKVEVYHPGRTDMMMRGLLNIDKEPPLVPQLIWDGVWCNAQGQMAAQMHDGTVHYWE